MAHRGYGVAARFIVDQHNNGDFSTISAALAAASSGDTIFINPGTYTENLTLISGVNLVAFNADAIPVPNVVILGTASVSFTGGGVNFSGINFQTNGGPCLSLTATSTIAFSGCYFSYEQTFPAFDISSNGGVELYQCNSSSNSGASFFTLSTGSVNIFGGLHYGTGISSGVGDIQFFNASIYFATSLTGSSTIEASQCNFATPVSNVSITCGGTVGENYLYGCSFETLTLSVTPIIVSAGSTLTVAQCIIDTPNATAIGGSGTLNYGDVTFVTSSGIANTLTLNGLVTLPTNVTPYTIVAGGPTTTSPFQNVSGTGTTGQVLVSAGAGALPTWQTIASNLNWNNVTVTSASMVADNGYLANNAGLVTLTLPATAAQFSSLRIAGFGAGGWTIAQNAGQTIQFGALASTTGTGGSLASTNQYDQVELLAAVGGSNTTWIVLDSVGNLSIT